MYVFECIIRAGPPSSLIYSQHFIPSVHISSSADELSRAPFQSYLTLRVSHSAGNANTALPVQRAENTPVWLRAHNKPHPTLQP